MYYLNNFNEIKKIYPGGMKDHAEKAIDELILPAIAILNQKGYKTSLSCSGHFVDDYSTDGLTKNDICYIAFVDDKQTLLKSGFVFPEGFNIKEDWISNKIYKTRIEKSYSPEQDRFLQMLNTARELYLWAISLPKRTYFD